MRMGSARSAGQLSRGKTKGGRQKTFTDVKTKADLYSAFIGVRVDVGRSPHSAGLHKWTDNWCAVQHPLMADTRVHFAPSPHAPMHEHHTDGPIPLSTQRS